MADLASTIAARGLVICLGPGGVGKTTAAAAFALAAARSGRRVAVVTVDPSRRLGEALGLDVGAARGGAVVPVLTTERDGAHLDALLLDGGTVFDTIVDSYAASPEAARRILDSRIYNAMSERLGGALEYAAMARVLMLHDAGEHDLVVLDTPPTANAIDFLSAPRRIQELVDNPAAKLVASGGRLGVRIVGLGGAVLMAALERLGGGEFLQQLAAFLADFAVVVREFHRRGGDFDRLMKSEGTGAVVVTTPLPFAIREAVSFAADLDALGLGVDGVLLNRVDAAVPPLDASAEAIIDARLPNTNEAAVIRLAYENARARGELPAQARRAFAARTNARESGLPVWAMRRWSAPPSDLADLEAMGAELLGASEPQ